MHDFAFIHTQGVVEDSHMQKTIKLLLLVSVLWACHAWYMRVMVCVPATVGNYVLLSGRSCFRVCFVSHEMNFASHGYHKNQNKSSAAFTVRGTFVFLCKQALGMKNEKWRWMNNTLLLHTTSEHDTDLYYNQACSHIWPRSLGWNGVCTFVSCMESRPCCAPIVYSLPRATVHPELDHKFLSVSWGWRFSCQGESWDSLNSHWRIWPLRQGGEIRMDCRKCKSVEKPHKLLQILKNFLQDLRNHNDVIQTLRMTFLKLLCCDK